MRTRKPHFKVTKVGKFPPKQPRWSEKATTAIQRRKKRKAKAAAQAEEDGGDGGSMI